MIKKSMLGFIVIGFFIILEIPVFGQQKNYETIDSLSILS